MSDTKTAEWVNDPSAESVLRRFSKKFTVKDIAMSEINESVSAKFAGRAMSSRVDDALAEEYATALTLGNRLPRIVVAKTHAGDNHYTILGGNTRHAAAKLHGLNAISVYEVEGCAGDMELLAMLPKALNRTHGKRLTMEETMSAVRDAINNYHWPIDKCAEVFRVSRDKINDFLRTESIRDILGKAQVSRAVEAKRQTLNVLARIPNEKILIATGRLALDSRLSADETAAIVKTVTSGRPSELEMFARLRAEEKKMGCDPLVKAVIKTCKQITNTETRTAIFRGLTCLERAVARKYTANQCGLTKADKPIVGARIKALYEKLTSVCLA